jgi:hypothetical protein
MVLPMLESTTSTNQYPVRVLLVLAFACLIEVQPGIAQDNSEPEAKSTESAAEVAEEEAAPIEQKDLPEQDLREKELTEEELQEGVEAIEKVAAESKESTAELVEDTAKVQSEIEPKTTSDSLEDSKREESIAPWNPPVSPVDRFDWIQLSSGEWLKGKIERLRDEEFEFDSDELDTVILDWEDVVKIRSPRRHVYRFGPELYVRGPSVMEGDTVTVVVENTKQEFSRKDLTAIVHGADIEWDNWDGNLNFAVAFRSGNIDQGDYSTQSWIRRETARSRVRIDLTGNLSTLDDEKTEDSVRTNLKWDIYWSRNFYITALNFEGFRDPFANIERRLTPSAGVGYHILRGKQDLEVEALAGFQGLQLVSVADGEDRSNKNASLTFGIISSLELTKRVDFDVSYRLTITLPETGDTSHNLTSMLSIDLISTFKLVELDLDVGFTFDRIEDPAKDENGDTPEKNDYRLSIGFGLEF